MKTDNRPIGVFDSGVGGLTVLKECVEILPNENYIYFGDIANAPYGDKSKEDIISYVRAITKFMKNNLVKAVVVACNTGCSCALDLIKKEYDFPIIGVIQPAVNEAVKVSVNKKIALIATKATVDSGSYKRAFDDYDIHNIKEIACRKFVPIIEKGFSEDEISYAIKSDMNELYGTDYDTLILGCTHFPLIEDNIKKEFPNLIYVNPALNTALELKRVLDNKDMLNNKREYIKIYYSKESDTLRKLGNEISDNIEYNLIKIN